MSTAEKITKLLKTRRLTLRLYYVDRPQGINVLRPYSFVGPGAITFPDIDYDDPDTIPIGIEFFGTIENATPQIISLVEENIQELYANLSIGPRIEPEIHFTTDGSGTSIFQSLAGLTAPTGNTGATGATGNTGATGADGASIDGITQQVLFFDEGVVTGSDDFLFDKDTGVLSLGQGGYLDGNLIGAIKKLVYGEDPGGGSISAGDPLYIIDNVGGSDRVVVGKADASNASKMPAAGVAADDIEFRTEGEMIITGVFDPYDTTGLTSNDSLYVASGGGLTTERPSGANDLIQNMARVGRGDKSNGSLLVAGAFRTNDVPNILKVHSYLEMPDGFTSDTIVSSVNGMTGDVTISSGSSEIVDSYAGLIEYPTNKEYFIDGYLIADRTINFFHVKCLTGGCTAELVGAGTTMATRTVSPTGDGSTFTGVGITIGSELSIVISGVTGGIVTEDFRFVVGYTQ